MDEKFKKIIGGFTGKQDRSQLAPYSKLIFERHRRDCSFRKIASILSENFGFKVASTTISRFVLRQEQEESKPRKTKSRKGTPVSIKPVTPTAPVKSMPVPETSPDEIRQRSAALKQQTEQPEPDIKRFEYNPDQPLHLVREDFL
jgi:IS30 family transposase